MRTFLKALAYLVVGLVVFVLGFAFYARSKSQSALAKTYAVAVRPVAIPADAAAIAHGRHLAQTRGCIECHGTDYAGGKVIESGPMGKLYGPNLTRGKGGRIGNFSDEDWIRAIRHGVGPDGRGLFIMPSEEYSKFSDEDLGALIAFLKRVPAVDRERTATSYGPVSQILLALSPQKMIAAAALDHAQIAPPVAVVKAPTAEYGKYVAASCSGCHGANYSGGKIEAGPPDWPLAANLTPHADGRLAKWNEADFIAAIRTAKRPDGSELNPVMPRGFGGMDDVELKALWAFFKALPPVAQGVR